MDIRRLGIALLGLAGMLAATPAGAVTYKVLHNFCAKSACADGSTPLAPVMIDGDGNLFGTTTEGGKNNGGAVYELVNNGSGYTYKTIYSLQTSTGSHPQGALLLGAKGRIYGTARDGGANGAGMIYYVSPNKTHTRWFPTVVRDFCQQPSCADGAHPISGLAYQGAPGTFAPKSYGYGLTSGGGTTGAGIEYLFVAGNAFPEYGFCYDPPGCASGDVPNADPSFGESDYVCFTAQQGGLGHGVLVCDPPGEMTGWTYNFCSQAACADGAEPRSGTVYDSGYVWGTTASGGANDKGTIYKTFVGPGHALSVMHDFCSLAACADGDTPVGAPILSGGNFYGTTEAGGNAGGGVLYKLDGGGALTVLHHFCSKVACHDGSAPQVNVISDGAGHLFGTTTEGGLHGKGVVFELTL